MSETEQSFTVAELQFLAFRCKCGLQITADILRSTLNTENPPHCPSCTESLEPLSNALLLYKRFYEAAKAHPIHLKTGPLKSKD